MWLPYSPATEIYHLAPNNRHRATRVYSICDHGSEPARNGFRLVLSDIYWGSPCEMPWQPQSGHLGQCHFSGKRHKNMGVRFPLAYSRVAEKRLSVSFNPIVITHTLFIKLLFSKQRKYVNPEERASVSSGESGRTFFFFQITLSH